MGAEISGRPHLLKSVFWEGSLLDQLETSKNLLLPRQD